MARVLTTIFIYINVSKAIKEEYVMFLLTATQLKT